MRNSKYLGFIREKALVRAFNEQIPNQSLSCVLNGKRYLFSVSSTGFSRNRDKVSDNYLVLNENGFIPYLGGTVDLVIVRPRLIFQSRAIFLYFKTKMEV